jgi:hypothetical protein
MKANPPDPLAALPGGTPCLRWLTAQVVTAEASRCNGPVLIRARTISGRLFMLARITAKTAATPMSRFLM